MNPEELIAELDDMDFDYFMDSMLDNVPDKLDKREGSVIYDAMAPAATELADETIRLKNIIKETYTSTADGEFLDLKAQEKGTVRQAATYAQVTAKFLDADGKTIENVEVNDRFASLGDEPIFYYVKRINEDKTGLLVAEEVGTRANGYLGQILPVTPNDSLSWAEITEISVPARDEEDDEHLRERLLSPSNWVAYGGNVTDYQDMLSKIDTVGAGQIYPAWQGGSTVKLVILDNKLMPASEELLKQVKEAIDPPASGEGYGLAPIGHDVTVVAPEKVTVDIATKVEVDPQKTLEQLTPLIQKAIEAYFQKRREDWDNVDTKTGRGYALSIYRSQLLSEIMKVEGVVNTTLPTLNGLESDLAMEFNDQKSQLPVVGEVSLA